MGPGVRHAVDLGYVLRRAELVGCDVYLSCGCGRDAVFLATRCGWRVTAIDNQVCIACFDACGAVRLDRLALTYNHLLPAARIARARCGVCLKIRSKGACELRCGRSRYQRRCRFGFERDAGRGCGSYVPFSGAEPPFCDIKARSGAEIPDLLSRVVINSESDKCAAEKRMLCCGASLLERCSVVQGPLSSRRQGVCNVDVAVIKAVSRCSSAAS